MTFIGLPKWQIETKPESFVTTLIAPPITYQKPNIARIPESFSTPKPPQASTPIVRESEPIDWLSLLPIAWWFSFSACLLHAGIVLIKAGLIARRSRPFGMETLDGREIPVRVSDEIPVPSMIGWRKPIILIPTSATEWSTEKRQMAIAHEAAHIQRNDWAWQQLSVLACAIHFFNPLAWWAAKRLREESELACDDSVIENGISATAYAQELLNIAKNAKRSNTALTGMASNPKITNRLVSILDEKRSRRTLPRRSAAGLLTGVGVLLLPFGMVAASSKTNRSKGGPPEVPLVHSEQIGRNVFLAKNGIASLPGGIRIKLVGVSGEPNGDLWGLDGKTIPDAADWRVRGSKWRASLDNRLDMGDAREMPSNRRFLFEIESEQGGEFENNFKIVNLVEHSVFQITPVANLQLEPRKTLAESIRLDAPGGQQKGNYHLGIAGGDWQTFSKTPNPFAGAKGAEKSSKAGTFALGLDSQPSLYFNDDAGKLHVIKLSEKIQEGLAAKMILRSEDGKVIEKLEVIALEFGQFTTMPLSRERLQKISTFEIETSPYRFAEFRDIPLRPDYDQEIRDRLNPHIRGHAAGIAPSFIKRLRSGATVSLESVTKAARDGGLWRFIGQSSWRGDGQVLAGDTVIHDFHMLVNPSHVNPPILYQIRVDGAFDPSTILVSRGDQKQTPFQRALSQFQAGYQTRLVSNSPSGAQTDTLDVGVASTPWKTICEYPINVPPQPPRREGNHAETTREQNGD